MSRAIKLARAGYRGDPGLFGFLGGLAKKVTGVAGSLLPGPLGAAAKFVSSAIPGGRPATPSPVARTGGWAPRQAYPVPARAMPGRPAPMPLATIQRGTRFTPPGPLTGIEGQFGPASGRMEFGPPVAAPEAGVPGARYVGGGPADGTVIQRDDIMVAMCPSGWRPNKSAYYEMSPAGGVIYHPPGTKCVKIQRRNPANARATDRAISRVTSAKRYAQSLGRITVRPKCCTKCSKK